MKANDMNTKRIPDKLVVLTFDDALNNHATFVAPRLKEYGFEATFFVCEFPRFHKENGSSFPGFEDKTCYMTWEQIRYLYESGFEIGNHTLHHTVATIPSEELRQEIEELDNRCLKYSIPKPRSFCYPAYMTSKEALSVLKDRGFFWARTGGGIPYDPLIHHPLLIPSFEAPLQKDLHSFEKMVNQAKNGAITVLLFHGAPDLAHPWVSMDQETFEVYMEYLYKNDFTVISMEGLGKYIDPIKAFEMIESRSSGLLDRAISDV